MNKIFLFLSLSITIFSFSQNKYSFGNVSLQELKDTQSGISPESPAEIIYKEVTVELNVYGEMAIQIMERIKIYDKDKARRYLTYSVPLYISSKTKKEDKMEAFKAVTYNLDNGNITEAQVKDDASFLNKTDKYLNQFKFTFPNVKDGSVLEYKYTIHTEKDYRIPTQYFDYEIPLRKMNYTAKVYSYYSYVPDLRGLNANKIKATKTKEEIGGRPYNVVNMQIENVKPCEKEPYVMSYQNIRTSIRYELAKIITPDGDVKNYSSSWQEIGKMLLKEDEFGGYYQKTKDNFKLPLETILTGLSTSPEKASAILNYVQENYRWNENNWVVASQNLAKTMETKTGNCADLNLLLVVMLREAGIDANPIVLSTVPNGVLNYAFPSFNKLDYVIAGFYDGGKLNILDATSRYSKLNQVPKRALNYRGFYIKKNDVWEVDLTNQTLSTTTGSLNYQISPDFGFSGTYNKASNNYFAMEEEEKYDKDKTKYERNIAKEYSFSIKDLKVAKENTLFNVSFTFDPVSDVVKAGKKVIFNPLLFMKEKEQIFKTETRTYPIELGSPTEIIKNVKFTIPGGYKIETLPETKEFQISDNFGQYTYTIKQEGKEIEINTRLLMNEFNIPAKYYSDLKKLWQNIIDAESQLISLIKE